MTSIQPPNATTVQPATLDLRNYVRNGLKWLKATDTKKLVEADEFMSAWGYGDVTGRMVDAFILARQVLGEDTISPEEERTRSFLLSLFDPVDGLSYRPKLGTKPLRVAHMFDQSSVLFGMVSWFLESGSPEIQRYLDNLIAGLWRIAVKKDDYCYYLLEFYSPGGWDENYPVKFGLNKFDKADPCHEGGRQILPLVRYYELTNNQTTLLLAQGLTNYVMYHAGVFEPDGSYRETQSRNQGHVHSRLATAAGVLSLGMLLKKEELVKWAKKVFDWTLETQSSTFGWVAEHVDLYCRACETCCITDAIENVILLAHAGFENYWNVLERFTRNHLLESQCPRCGGFDGRSMPNDFCWLDVERKMPTLNRGASGCCSPAGVRALFLVWDNIVTREGELVKVNLSLNRVTKWVDVQSFLPYRGEVLVAVKEALDLAVRVPNWVKKSEVKVFLNGSSVSGEWAKDFIKLGGLKRGAQVLVQYPVRRVVLTEVIMGHPFEVTWRGDTVVAISPSGTYEPLYERSHLDTDWVEVKPQKFSSKEVHW
jgi:hypothetical protein